jgi:uncharacterized lipoprotein YmbA
VSRVRLYPLGLSVSCLLLACSASPPTRYFALNAIAPASAGVAGAAGEAAAKIRLEPVAIPPELDRLELVTHSGANRIQIADQDRWAAPLDEQIRRTLSDDLGVRLPEHLVADPNEPATQDARRKLSISIGQLDVNENCALLLSASWTISVTKASSQSGVEQVQIPGSAACPAGMAAAVSQALAALADRLAPVLAQP